MSGGSQRPSALVRVSVIKTPSWSKRTRTPAAGIPDAVSRTCVVIFPICEKRADRGPGCKAAEIPGFREIFGTRGEEPQMRGLGHLEKEEPATFFAFVGAVAHRDHLDVCGGEALVAETKFFRGAWRDVQMTAGDEGTAVVDADFQRFAVIEVGHLDEAGQRERFVSASEMPWHDFLADGCVAALEAEELGFVIPGAGAGFLEIERLFDTHRAVVLAAHGVGTRHVASIAAGA